MCSLGDGNGIYTKKKEKRERESEGERVVIHSNSTGFVKLLLSICHHKSHFDSAFLGAFLHARFCFLILQRRPGEFRGGCQEQKNRDNTRPRKRREKANCLKLASQGENNG